MKSISIFENLISKHVRITKRPNNFLLNGILTEIIDNETIRFETSTKESVIDISQIVEVVELERDVSQDVCNRCGGLFYKKTSFVDICPECQRTADD